MEKGKGRIAEGKEIEGLGGNGRELKGVREREGENKEK